MPAADRNSQAYFLTPVSNWPMSAQVRFVGKLPAIQPVALGAHLAGAIYDHHLGTLKLESIMETPRYPSTTS